MNLSCWFSSDAFFSSSALYNYWNLLFVRIAFYLYASSTQVRHETLSAGSASHVIDHGFFSFQCYRHSFPCIYWKICYAMWQNEILLLMHSTSVVLSLYWISADVSHFKRVLSAFHFNASRQNEVTIKWQRKFTLMILKHHARWTTLNIVFISQAIQA